MSHAPAIEGDEGARLTGQARADYVRSLFSRIVPRYDLFNTLSTFGQDRRWRRMVVSQAAAPADGQVLDVATGTGAVAFALARRTPTASVVGLDFCQPMIERARGLAASRTGIARGVTTPPTFVEGDILALPYGDNAFDAVTISFGLRNVADIPQALAEIHRVLRPGGRFVCLELTHPRSALIRVPFHLYFFKLSPLLGALLSGDLAAYTYLPHSLISFPDAPTLAGMLRQAGFTRVRHKGLNLGTIAIHRGIK
ncbi:MAG TPA: class I SAM-dependent methyltransferase [Chloroflexota bacterium]|nr:class I SAM-dependent methyltransferase [Chloroflexota bacterium]